MNFIYNDIFILSSEATFTNNKPTYITHKVACSNRPNKFLRLDSFCVTEGGRTV